jgi:hypothetical protein
MRQPHVLLPFFFFNDNDLLPSSRAAFVSPHLFSRDRNGLAAAVIVFRRVRPFPSCFCRVLSLRHLILKMTKRQRGEIGSERIDKLHGTRGTMTEVVSESSIFFWLRVDETVDAGGSSCRVGEEDALFLMFYLARWDR